MGNEATVTFRSSAFNTSEVRPYFINDYCFGDDLARWMIGRLRDAGVETGAEPGQEDFGWYFEFSVPSGRHCCVLGFRPDDDAWFLWLERSRGFVGSVLGMRNRGIGADAVNSLNDALTGAGEITDLQWQSG